MNTSRVQRGPLGVNGWRGFTLIELLVVVAIIGILAAIVLPSFQEQVRRGKRAEGRSALLDAAAQMERIYSDCNAFNRATPASCVPALNPVSENGYYAITSNATANTYTVSAAPTFTDANCDTLTLNQAGTKGESGTRDVAYCW